MEYLKSVMRDYKKNQVVLLGLFVCNVLFFMTNYVFFRNTIDVPADMIFTVFYMIFVPGIVTLITLVKDDFKQVSNKIEFGIRIIVHMVIPLLIIGAFIFVYDVIRSSDSYYWETLLKMIFISVPILFLGSFIGLESYLGFDKVLIKILGLLGLYASYYVLSLLLFDFEHRYILNLITIFYLYGLPLLIVVFYYPRKIVKNR